MKHAIRLFLFAVAGWFIFPAPPAHAETGPIKVGAFLPLSGELARVGEQEKNAFLMAVEKINGAGGIRGQAVRLIVEDSAGPDGEGPSAMKRLISDHGVVAVTGGVASTQTFRAAALAEELKTPFLITTASADRITTQGWAYVFRLTPPAGEYMDPLRSFIKRVGGVKTAAVIFEEGAFGHFGRKRFERFRRGAGIKLVRQERFIEGTSDFVPLFEWVRVRHPDLVYMVASGPATPAFMIRSAKAIDLNPRLFFGHGEGFINPNLPRYAGGAAEGVFSTTLWIPSVPYPGSEEFADRYEEQYGSLPDYHGAQAYAALSVIANALKRAESMTRSAVRDALARTQMKTVFGPVRFADYGDKTQQNHRPMLVVQWMEGRLETVWPGNSASATYRFPQP
ncbi:MAG: ABC transporter substrate-binding protein [Deltaproteobacteria bacterium]|nr:ABC transporter substrate-binding protein [Deltaproteobacteria bacterium]